MDEYVKYFEYYLESGDSVEIILPFDVFFIFKENHKSFQTTVLSPSGSSSGNTISNYGIEANYKATILYGPYIGNTGVSGSLKFGIVRIPSGCQQFMVDFEYNSIQLCDYQCSSDSIIINKDTHLCFAWITNDQMKYEIEYSTQPNHNLWAIGPNYGDTPEIMFTSSTSITYTKSIISKPRVFYLQSDGVSSSRYISISVENPEPPIQTPEPSIQTPEPPIQTPQPSQSSSTYSITSINEQVKCFDYVLNDGESLEISLSSTFVLTFMENHASFRTTITSPSGSASDNSKNMYWVNSNSIVTILYGPYIGNDGVSGSLKISIAMVPSECNHMWVNSVPGIITFEDRQSDQVSGIINKDSKFCLAMLSNDELKYDITYSTQNNHLIYVYGPQLGNILYQLSTPSTSDTYTLNITSKPLVFYLESDGIASSRYLRVLAQKKQISPSLSGNSSSNSSSGSSLTTVVAVVFVLVAIVGVLFFVTQNKKQDIKSSSSSNQEKKEEKKKKKSDKKDKKHKLKDIPEHVPQPSPPQYSVPPPQQYPYPPQQYPYPPQQQFYNPGYPPSQYNQNPIAPPQSTTPKTQVEQI